MSEKREPDGRDREGKTVLLLAAKAGNTPVLSSLLAAGVDAAARDANQRSAVELARLGNQPRAVERLVTAQ